MTAACANTNENQSCTPPTVYQCNDGLDNDTDGQTDYPNDRGCSSATDNNETAEVTGAFSNWTSTYILGSGLTLNFPVAGDLGEVNFVKFKVRTPNVAGFEAILYDTTAPYEYLPSSINTVTPGNKEIYVYIYGRTAAGQPYLINFYSYATLFVSGVVSNSPPNVDAGLDQTITLPSGATLDATVTDDNLPNPPAMVITTWSMASGPGNVTFGNANAVDTTATFSAAGTYTLRLTADDNQYSTPDDVVITVNPAPPSNTAPHVNAGLDQAITLPALANLDGTVSDDGLPTPPTLTYVWSKVFGAGTVTFGNANAVDTTAIFSMAGTYVLRLTVNDGALPGQDEVSITVNPLIVVNQAPVVNAGANQNITLPVNSVNLAGTATDDGLPNPPAAVTTVWSKTSGSGNVAFANANALSTTASFSQAGTYILRLTASDSVRTGYDELLVSITAQGAATSNALSPLATNVAEFNYYSPQLPFKNMFWLNTGKWNHISSNGVATFDPLPLDADGYPLGLATGRFAYTFVLIHRGGPDTYPAGQYVVLYDGDGDLAFAWDAQDAVRTGPGRYTINIPRAIQGIQIYITRSNPNNHLRNIRIIKPEYEAPGPENYETQPFRPEFLARLEKFRGLRFMNWMEVGALKRDLFDFIVGASFNTVRLPWAASANPNFYIGKQIRVTNGAGLAQQRMITGYDSSTKIVTVASPFNPVPARGDPFLIEGIPSITPNEFLESATANTITFGPASSNVNDFYKGMVVMTSGTWQRRYIASYNGATRVATLSAPWATIPPNGTAYSLSQFLAQEWDNRARLSWMNLRANGQSTPVEIMVKLANTVHADAWFSMPPAADDNYVRNFAEYVRDNLDPGLKAYVQYSNETWNYGYPGNTFAMARGAELGQGGYAPWAWEAVRAVEMFKIWTNVFGEAELRSGRTAQSRLDGVLGGQSAYCYSGVYIMDMDSSRVLNGYPSPFAPGTNAAAYMNTYTFAPYFGPRPGESVAGRSLNEIFTSTAQFIDEMFIPASTCGQYPRSVVFVNVLNAQVRGLNSKPYEGGQHFASATGVHNYYGTAAAATSNTVTLTIPSWQTFAANYFDGWYATIKTGPGAGESRRIVSYDGVSHVATLETPWVTIPDNTSTYLLRSEINYKEDGLNSDPLIMYDLYTRYFTHWKNLGVNANNVGAREFFHFLDISPMTEYGRWGSEEYEGQPISEAPKKRALMDFISNNPQWWQGR